jgi:pimeloyl-ACP methyl ester carboxylesterase
MDHVTTSLILLPGLLCDRALWEPQIAALSDVCVPWVARSHTQRQPCVDGDAGAGGGASQAVRARRIVDGGYVAMEIMRQAPERVTRLALLDTGRRLIRLRKLSDGTS